MINYVIIVWEGSHINIFLCLFSLTASLLLADRSQSVRDIFMEILVQSLTSIPNTHTFVWDNVFIAYFWLFVNEHNNEKCVVKVYYDYAFFSFTLRTTPLQQSRL